MAKRFAAGASLPTLDAHFSWKAIFDEARKHSLYSESAADLAPTVRLFHAAAQGVDQNDILAQMLAADTHVGLEGDMLVKADRMTMATSLEGRVPLLDHPLVELVASLPSRFKMKGMTTKVLLRRAMQNRLPQQTSRGAKKGFNVPIPSWLVGPLREMVHDTLSSKRISESGWFRPDAVSELIRAHEARERDHSRDIWTLLMFQTWYDRIATTEPEAIQRRRVS
jgi:asparagine synthase (glutamine-hydrolysing)